MFYKTNKSTFWNNGSSCIMILKLPIARKTSFNTILKLTMIGKKKIIIKVYKVRALWIQKIVAYLWINKSYVLLPAILQMMTWRFQREYPNIYEPFGNGQAHPWQYMQQFNSMRCTLCILSIYMYVRIIKKIDCNISN